MLGGKHSANCSRLDCAEKKASKGKRKQIIQVVPMNRRQFERRNSLRDDADQFHLDRAADAPIVAPARCPPRADSRYAPFLRSRPASRQRTDSKCTDFPA